MTDSGKAPKVDRTVQEKLLEVLEVIQGPLGGYLRGLEAERKASLSWSYIKRTALVAVFILGLCMWLFGYGTLLGVQPTVLKPSVAQVDISGEIGDGHLASADRIVPLLTELCRQPMVKGLVLHIDSPGGSPGDAERIGAAVDDCKVMPAVKGRPGRRKRLVVAVIDNLGASAAYMIAIHADRIVANPTGLVGSIGIIIEGMKFNGLMDKLGVGAYAYSSGALKSMLSPYTPDTPAQQAVAQTLVQDAMRVFQADVIAHRPHLKLDTPDLWSGRVWVAMDAKNIGLIDGVGVLEPVVKAQFKGLPVQRFDPQRNIRDALSMSSWVHAVSAEMVDRAWHER